MAGDISVGNITAKLSIIVLILPVGFGWLRPSRQLVAHGLGVRFGSCRSLSSASSQR
jgi:hypothetical protein